MENLARRAAQIIAIMLISLVVTQVIYVVMSDAGMDINRPVIWTVEAIASLGLAVAGLVCLARGSDHPAAWAAIAAGGLLNTIQVGMGIAMFPPLMDAGEALKPAFDAVLAGAFFLYFAGKALFGVAAFILGHALWAHAGKAAKLAGAFAVLAGAAAIVTNVFAMGAGMDEVFRAGAAGTAASLALALAIIARLRGDAA